MNPSLPEPAVGQGHLEAPESLSEESELTQWISDWVEKVGYPRLAVSPSEAFQTGVVTHLYVSLASGKCPVIGFVPALRSNYWETSEGAEKRFGFSNQDRQHFQMHEDYQEAELAA